MAVYGMTRDSLGNRNIEASGMYATTQSNSSIGGWGSNSKWRGYFGGKTIGDELRKSGARGEGVYRFTIIAPPDDRYLPGYSIVDENGKKTYVGPRLKDLSVNYSVYGLPIPITFGIRRLPANIIWANPLIERTERKRSGGGKGGGKKKKKETTYSYYATFASSFGKPVGAAGTRQPLRIWGDSTLLVDRRAGSRGTKYQSLRYTFHPGAETQGADPIIKFYNDIDGIPTPAYRDLMYIVFDELPVADFGDRVPNITAEIGDGTTITSEIVTFGTEAHESTWAADLTHERAYLQDSTNTPMVIHKYNLRDEVLEQSITLEDPGWSGASDRFFLYLPSEEAFVTCNALLTASQQIGLFDAWSGNLISTINVSGSGTFGVNDGDQPDQFTFGSISNGLYEDTYFFGFTLQDTLTCYKISATTRAISWVYAYSGLTSKSFSAVCRGTEFIGQTDFYFATTTGEVYKISIVGNTTEARWGSGGAGVEWYDFGSSVAILSMMYDKYDDSLVFTVDTGTVEKVVKLDINSKTILWETADLNLQDKENSNTANYSDINDGLMTYTITSSGGWAEVDLRNGSVTTYTGSPTVAGGHIFDGRRRAMYGVNVGSDRLQKFRYDLLNDERRTLKEFLELCATLAGYTVGTNFEVDTEIDDDIDGAYITERISFRALLDACSTIYAFDVIESGGKLKCVRKPKSLTSASYDFAITADEVAASTNENPNATAVTTRREMDLTLPRSIEITYVDKTRDYGYTTQHFQRTINPFATMASTSTLSVRVPIIMNAAEAKTLAYRALFLTWASRVTYSFRMPQNYMYLEPSDVGTVQVVGNEATYTYVCRIVEASYNADYSVSFKAVGYVADEPVTIEADAGTYLQADTPYFSLGLFIPIDCVLLRPRDDGVYPNAQGITLYGVAYPLLALSTRWSGGYAQISLDDINWNDFEWFYGVPQIGRMMNQLGIPENTQSSDTVNTIQVVFQNDDFDGSIATITDLELVNGGNVALVGSHRTGWEVVQFRDVSGPDANGIYTLSHLLRGRLGSEYMTGHAEFSSGSNPHFVGEFFIILDPDDLRYSFLPLTSKDTVIPMRFVSNSQTEPEAYVSRFAFTAESAKCLEPVNLGFAVSGSDLVATCHRRSRGPSDWGDGIGSVPVWESAQTVYIKIYQNSDGTGNSLELQTTENGDGLEEVTFTAANLNTVYGTSTPATIYATSYQYSPFLTENGRSMSIKAFATGL